ncbi:P-loop containing nucleoside triphosphate hydrolase protein [Xylariaceae sp. FL0594]|nr:P-loop containing nucleoside triphosphate hydrolase protein [Xylariaceae sp. FL0594]
MAQPFHAGGTMLGLGPIIGGIRAEFASIRRLISRGYELLNASGASQALTFWSVLGLGTTFVPNIIEVFYTIRRYVRVFFTSSVTIRASDELYLQVFNWLAKRESERTFIKEYTAQTLSDARAMARPYSGRRPWLSRAPQNDTVTTKETSRIKYTPAFRTTWFLHNRNLFAILRNDKHSHTAIFPPSSVTPVYDYYGPVPVGGDHKESVTITCLGWSTAPIQRLLEACREMAEENRRTSVTIRTCRDQQWELSAVKPIRTLDTIYLDRDVRENLLGDIKKYLDPQRRRFYSEQGIPYRRGYLLYGPPGCGKSTLSLALACKFGLDLYMVNIGNLYDGDLEYLFASLPARCLVLLEDIDAVGFRRPEDEDTAKERRYRRRNIDGSNKCSLSSLLNVLDGVASQEGRIVIMTTNHPELLDEALIRPGRIDVKVHMGYISKEGAEQLFIRMMKTARLDPYVATAAAIGGGGSGSSGAVVRDPLNPAPPQQQNHEKGAEQDDAKNPSDQKDDDLQLLASEFAEKVPEDTFSPAQIQGYLLRYLHSATMARDKIADWVADEKRKAEEKAKEAAESPQQKDSNDHSNNNSNNGYYYQNGGVQVPPEILRMTAGGAPGGRRRRKTPEFRNQGRSVVVQLPDLEALAKASTKMTAAAVRSVGAGAPGEGAGTGGFPIVPPPSPPHSHTTENVDLNIGTDGQIEERERECDVVPCPPLPAAADVEHLLAQMQGRR